MAKRLTRARGFPSKPNNKKENHMFDIGNKVLIRTVTYHLLGEITGRDGDWLTLKDASWVADSGRFANALATGDLAEVEVVGDAAVNLAAAVDAFPWTHALPTVTE